MIACFSRQFWLFRRFLHWGQAAHPAIINLPYGMYLCIFSTMGNYTRLISAKKDCAETKDVCEWSSFLALLRRQKGWPVSRPSFFCILPRASCEEQSPWKQNYLRTSGFTTRPERRQRVHTVRVATRPSGNWWRTRCRLGLKRRLVLILEWLTRLPTCGVFPQKAQHLLMIILQKQECSSWVGAEPLSDLCLVTHAQKYLFNLSSDAINCKLKSLFSPKKVTNNCRFVGPLLCACTLFVPFGLRLTTRNVQRFFAAYHRSGQKIRFGILMRMLGPEDAGTRKLEE